MTGCCGWSKEYPYIRLFSFSSFTTIPTETNALFYICLQNCRQFPNQLATFNWQWDFNLLPKTRDYKKRDLWLTRQFNRSSKWNDKSNSSHPSRIAKGILCGVHSAGEKRQSGSRMEAPAAARRFGFTATHAQMTTKFAFARHDLWPLNAPAASFHSFFFVHFCIIPLRVVASRHAIPYLPSDHPNRPIPTSTFPYHFAVILYKDLYRVLILFWSIPKRFRPIQRNTKTTKWSVS